MKQFSVQFNEQPFRPVFTYGGTKFMQLSFPKGKVLAKHQTDHLLTLLVLDGKIRFEVNGESKELKTHDMIAVNPRQEHEVEALEQSTVLLVLLPAEPNESV